MAEASYQWTYDEDAGRFYVEFVFEGQSFTPNFSWEDIMHFAQNMDAIVRAAAIHKEARAQAATNPLYGTQVVWEAPHND